MPKITRHGGSSNMYEIEGDPPMTVAESLASFDESLVAAIESDLTDIQIAVDLITNPELAIRLEESLRTYKEDTSSVGDNSLKSSRPTQTINEILGIDPQ